MNDDPKWDELEQYIRGWAKDTAAKVHDDLTKEALILHLGPQVEADEWPDCIGDTE